MFTRGLLSVIAIWIAVGIVLMLGCKPSTSRDTLRIAAASNQAIVMRDIIKAWQNKTGFQAELITGSSGKLTAQISSGAPFDIFLAADRSYITSLLAAGYIQDSISTYARGKLALIGETLQGDLEDQIKKSRRIAIANPDIAPYGKASITYLENLTKREEWTSKLAYAENVAQVHQYVYTGAADIGITALGLKKKQSDKDGLQWHVLDGPYNEVEQLFAVVSRTHLTDLATSFRSFVMGPKGQRILRTYGYSTSSAR